MTAGGSQATRHVHWYEGIRGMLYETMHAWMVISVTDMTLKAAPSED